MKLKVSIASGKGGTGKTTLSVQLARYLSKKYRVTYFDTDVDAPNGHLFLNKEPKIVEHVNRMIPKVDHEKCTFCGKCSAMCQFHAIIVLAKKKRVMVFPELCKGCGGCSLVCPETAISEIPATIGTIRSADDNELNFTGGLLRSGEATGVPIINRLSKIISKTQGISIVDAPPGNSCYVVVAINNSDYTILVTEATPFGLSDLMMSVELLRNMNLNFGIVVNKADNDKNLVRDYCNKEKLEYLGTIPFSRKAAEEYSKGIINISEEIPIIVEKLLKKIGLE